ncbi:uncharacterized protein PRCAT00005233001 [Priceomyces carsonii]|uniref:uncharacterized protein n=1 Tax=Priceomyces carsonii TaxID=28549 RepID=UPI002EDAFEF2|nr:unnamed protein product [Priceomyces carsonii]
MSHLKRCSYNRIRRCLSLHSNKRPESYIAKLRKDLNDQNNVNKRSGIKVTNLGDGLKATKDLLQKKKANSSTFFDPANTSLNLLLDNKTLYSSILNDTLDRTMKRFDIASKNWLSTFESVISKDQRFQVKKGSKEAEVEKALLEAFENATISSIKANEPIRIGDLVALHEDSSNLFLIVACPTSLSSNSYTFINNEGEIVFGPKLLIKLRVPGVVPSKYTAIIQTFVQLERKHMNIAPIGVSDSSFSRSNDALPKELRTLNETPENFNVEGQKGNPDVESDLIVAQASSQLLTNSNVNTYVVPIKARQLYSKGLVQLSLKVFEELPEISKKLEILHKVLQFDLNNDTLDSPKDYSIFQLLLFLDMIELPLLNKKLSLEDYKFLNESLSKEFAQDITTSEIGAVVPSRESGSVFVFENHPIASYLALVLSLKKQPRSWIINQRNKSDPPLSVSVLPARNIPFLSEMVKYLKFDKGKDHFANFVIKKMNEKLESESTKYYDEIIHLFKGYVAGNFENDPEIETLLVDIIRLIDKSSTTQFKNMPAYSYEYSMARAYEILQTLDNKNGAIHNPICWSYRSQTPAISTMNQMRYEYYNYLDSNYSRKDIEKLPVGDTVCDGDVPLMLGSFENPISHRETLLPTDFFPSDPFQGTREDFTNIPIYCIDSESAHEIDDGISLHTAEGKYVVSVHIAHPTSYMRPTSIISQIALSKGSTVYLPEGPTMMLPNLISQLAGLGVDGYPTRTFVIQYELDKDAIDSYILRKNHNKDYKPEVSLSKLIVKQIKESARIKLGVAKKFPQNFTYAKVNELLSDSENISKFKRRSADEDVTNLFKLFNIATILNDARIMVGNGLEMNSSKSSIVVEYSDTSTADTNEQFCKTDSSYEIRLDGDNPKTIKILNNQDQGHDSLSQMLVSHFMIFANFAASIFAKTNGIPVIYRSQQMQLNKTITDEITKLCRGIYQKGTDLSVEQVSQIISVLTGAKLGTVLKKHESLGLESYATVTSPLRRFVDMVNHWMFEEYLNKQKSFDGYQLEFIATQLQSHEMINKKMQLLSDKFWEGIFLRTYCKLLNGGKVKDPIQFKLLIKSSPKFGPVSVDVLGFNNLRAKLENTSDFIEAFNLGKIKIGSILDSDKLRITKIDFIEDELTFEFKQ